MADLSIQFVQELFKQVLGEKFAIKTNMLLQLHDQSRLSVPPIIYQLLARTEDLFGAGLDDFYLF